MKEVFYNIFVSLAYLHVLTTIICVYVLRPYKEYRIIPRIAVLALSTTFTSLGIIVSSYYVGIVRELTLGFIVFRTAVSAVQLFALFWITSYFLTGETDKRNKE